MSLIETSNAERKLASSIDPNVTHNLAISDKAGGISFVSMEEVMNFAKLMSLSSVAIPKHLRGNPGACLAVCIQALEWSMSPFSVANKSYSVNDRLSYEAQLVEAVILRRAPIKGRPKIEYNGDGEARVCKIWAELRDEPGEIVSYESPKFGKITPKNSPLWKADPDQQHFYYSVRAWCRRHFPDVLLGVYARDEIEDHPELAAAVGVSPRPATKGLSNKLEALARKSDHDKETGEIIEHEATHQTSAAQPDKSAPDEAGAGSFPDLPEENGAVDAARERGAKARRDGTARKAVPAEFRSDDRVAEADAWVAGWSDEDKRMKDAGDDFPGDRPMTEGR